VDHLLATHKEHSFWYIDDILVSACQLHTLRNQVRAVLATLRKAGCEVNHEKSVLETQGLLFGGMWIYKGGRGPNHEKREQLRTLPPPHTKVEKQSALGLISYLREHLPLASELTAALSTRKGERTGPICPKKWSEFTRQISNQLVTVAAWEDGVTAQLYTDASKQGCSALLLQNGRIVALASRKLSPAETRYSTTDREHLGLVLGATKFKILLHSHSRTEVLTDHSALLNRRWHDLTPRQTRWRVTIATWMPKLVHVPGKSNPADFLSRWGVEIMGGQIDCAKLLKADDFPVA